MHQTLTDRKPFPDGLSALSLKKTSIFFIFNKLEGSLYLIILENYFDQRENLVIMHHKSWVRQTITVVIKDHGLHISVIFQHIIWQILAIL